MDSYEWKHQLQSVHQPCANLLKINLEDHQSPDSALTLFTPEPSGKNDEIAAAPTSIPFAVPRMGHFSWTQWQELELQALIYKYIISGVAVPLELIIAVKRSLLSASPYYPYPLLYHHLCPSSLQSGYWGRFAVDPEPGRCRRTDGKKWRCSRDAMPGQKYCERHVHRGRNRSRKHVETSSPTLVSCLKATMSSAGSTTEPHYTPSESLRTLEILPLNQSRREMEHLNGSFQKNTFYQGFEGNKHEGHVLRRFFDEQPRSDEGPNTANNENHPMNSLDHLPVPIPGSSSSSEFSLKLCMGNVQQMPVSERTRFADNEGVPTHQPSANWLGWGGRGEAPLGGPLAEALRRSSTLSDSPTSVLQKPKGSMSETTSGISV